ncbi:hypothetical protein AA0Y32_08350 [Georgenia phoenicis]|uniref:hypothetical protein n=1 Tax=unclassified Georgenia TaxID=2626815 RepID=UPI0039AF1613
MSLSPSRRERLTLRQCAGLMLLCAAVSCVLLALDDLTPRVPSLLAAVVLGVAADRLLQLPRGVAPLYRHAPTAPTEARERGTLATAVIDLALTARIRLRRPVVGLQLFVAGPDGPYLTTTAARVRRRAVPSYTRGDVVAVRVHPEQPGVVVVVDEVPPSPAPRRPESGRVREYSGEPRPTIGRPFTELGGGLVLLVPIAIGALAPLVVAALLSR